MKNNKLFGILILVLTLFSFIYIIMTSITIMYIDKLSTSYWDGLSHYIPKTMLVLLVVPIIIGIYLLIDKKQN